MGVVFGAPVLASELEHSTNRLVWTQSVSRTRWLLTKWVVVLVPLIVFADVLTPSGSGGAGTPTSIGCKRSRGTGECSPSTSAGPGSSPSPTPSSPLPSGRPSVPSSGRQVGPSSAPSSSTASGCCSWSSRFERTSRRQELFTSNSPATLAPESAWDLGYGYRYTPGSVQPAGALSASEVGFVCERAGSAYPQCLASHNVQGGELCIFELLLLEPPVGGGRHLRRRRRCVARVDDVGRAALASIKAPFWPVGDGKRDPFANNFGQTEPGIRAFSADRTNDTWEGAFGGSVS